MRIFIMLILVGLFVKTSYAQPTDRKVSKVTFEMVDGKYEKAIKRTEKLLDDFEYRKNGWLYFYLAQSYFEVSKKMELADDYPRAFKNSLKAAYKLSKYRDEDEKNKSAYKEASEFLSTLKDSAITLSEIYYDNENPRKGAYYLKKVMKFDNNDYALQLMEGVYEIKARNIGAGIKNITAAIDSIDENYVPDPESAQTLVDALEEYALILKSGEYDKYFKAYKFEPTQSDIDKALAMKTDFKKYIVGKEVSKEARKKDSEIIYKSFKSEDTKDEVEKDDDE